MRYALLLKPHANVRYRDSLAKLALAELRCTLAAWEIQAEAHGVTIGGEPFLTFETDALKIDAWHAVSLHSGVCFAAEWRTDGALMPLERTHATALPEDLPQVLKYKGKTNADFTAMLLHVARDASQFAQTLGGLTVIDPVCGKATAPFCALLEGHDAVGVDVDAKALNEADVYLERSLKLHHIKHKRDTGSQTLRSGGSARRTSWTMAASAEDMKQGFTQQLTLYQADSTKLDALLRPQSCHVLIGDLPYGVQHAPQEGQRMSTLLGLLRRAMPAWASVIKHGGAMALSFNTYTLPRSEVLSAMQSAGLEPLIEPPFDDFSHWVEQAVERDIAVARKV